MDGRAASIKPSRHIKFRVDFKPLFIINETIFRLAVAPGSAAEA
jgi:hypothetical protein